MATEDHKKLQPTRHRSTAAGRFILKFNQGFERAIFPIITLSENGVRELAGTGFFIAPGGIFASAKHVFEGDDIDKSSSLHIMQDDSERNLFTRQIVQTVLHDEFDLMIGKLGEPHEDCNDCANHPIVSAMNLWPEKNEVIGSFTFAHTVFEDVEKAELVQGETEAIQQIKYRSAWEMGHGEEYFPNGQGFVKGPAFRSSVFVEGRGSGGPVFNSNGFVVGINSRGLAEDEGLPYSYASLITGIFDMEIDGRPIREHRNAAKSIWPNKPTCRLYKVK